MTNRPESAPLYHPRLPPPGHPFCHPATRMPRCCDAAAADLAPCYASALVTGGRPLADALEALEDAPICPCVTAWCPRCRRVSALTAEMAQFPTPAAHFAHALALHARLEDTLRAVRRERCR